MLLIPSHGGCAAAGHIGTSGSLRGRGLPQTRRQAYYEVRRPAARKGVLVGYHLDFICSSMKMLAMSTKHCDMHVSP